MQPFIGYIATHQEAQKERGRMLQGLKHACIMIAECFSMVGWLCLGIVLFLALEAIKRVLVGAL